MLGALEEGNDLPEKVNESKVVELHKLPWWLRSGAMPLFPPLL